MLNVMFPFVLPRVYLQLILLSLTLVIGYLFIKIMIMVKMIKKTDVIIINNDNDNLYTIESSSDQVQYLCSYQSCGFKNIPVLKFQSK